MSIKMTPQLRFPEFTDEWQVKKLGDVFDRVTRKNKENNQNILTISAQDGLVSQEKFFSKIVAAKDVSGYYLLHKNDYAYNKSYSKGYPMGAIKRLSRDEKGVVSTLYICFSSKQGLELFFDQYFEAGRLNTEIEKIAQEGARNHGLLNMAVGDFFTTKLVIPVSKPEQEKIADFLTAVDERIGVSEKKLELLETYKRGVMQQIFSQKIRFKDENGNEYPEWEEKKLSEIASFVNGYTFLSSTYDKSGKYSIITIANVQEGRMDTTKASRVKDMPFNIQKDQILQLNDILISMTGNVGRVCRVDTENCLLNQRVGKIVTNAASADFVFAVLNSKKFLVEMETLAQGGAQGNLSSKDIMKYKFLLPSYNEQQKIATFLAALDDKITAEKSKLTATRQFKKALLQRMFV